MCKTNSFLENVKYYIHIKTSKLLLYFNKIIVCLVILHKHFARLGTLETKVALISILRKYKVDVYQKTITLYISHFSTCISLTIREINTL